MNCPICNGQMERGKILVSGMQVYALWFSEEQAKKWLPTGGKRVGNPGSQLGGGLTLENAYFCPACKKIIGLFDIK